MQTRKIRPKLGDLTFDTREQAEEYMHTHPLYGQTRLKFWVDSGTNGKFRIYCEGFISLTNDELQNLDQPYYEFGVE